jgi:S-formylglutathione hydrolase FrmB
MPDGDDGWYSNWASPPPDYATCLAGQRGFGVEPDMHTYCVKKASYEDYIVKDLIAHVDATYRTIPERRARAIGGLSMGGFGALTLGLRHRDRFAAIVSHSGVDSLFYKGPHPYDAGKVEIVDNQSVPLHWGEKVGGIGVLVRKVFGSSLANWEAHDPATLASKLHDGDIALYFDVGTEDYFGLDAEARYLDSVLTRAGVRHRAATTSPSGRSASTTASPSAWPRSSAADSPQRARTARAAAVRRIRAAPRRRRRRRRTDSGCRCRPDGARRRRWR